MKPLPLNKSIPEATVIPVLRYPDVTKVAEWLSEAFGFSVRVRIFTHRIQMNVGDGALVIADGDLQGEDAGGDAYYSVMIRVANTDSHCERAIEAGARIIDPPTDYPFGERQYSAADPWGRKWTFSQTIADVDPASWGGTLR